MMDIMDKNTRLALVAKYLEAETTVHEETLLAAYYAANEADEDERAVAQMLRIERADAPWLTDEGAEEFDRLVAQAKAAPRKPAMHRTLWISGVAATIALLLVLNLHTMHKAEQQAPFDTIEIAEHIQQMMNLNMGDVTSISASPIQECVLLTATLADGTTKTFVMSRGTEEGSTSLLAID